MALSSTFQNQAATVQSVMNALANLRVRVLVTLGPALLGTRLTVPDNAVVVNAAPHDVVMREAALVVTHCGHGTVARALAHGLPMLCLPMGRDQNDNAARVVARDAGLRLAHDATAEEIATASCTLLDDPGYAAAARRLPRRSGSRRWRTNSSRWRHVDSNAPPREAGFRPGSSSPHLRRDIQAHDDPLQRG
jgi:UDP:flavonoid glycosyltransferase YjiC (YdhE family)